MPNTPHQPRDPCATRTALWLGAALYLGGAWWGWSGLLWVWLAAVGGNLALAAAVPLAEALRHPGGRPTPGMLLGAMALCMAALAPMAVIPVFNAALLLARPVTWLGVRRLPLPR